MPINQRYDTFFKRLIAGIIDGFVFLPLNWTGDYLAENSGPDFALSWSVVQTIIWTLYVVIGHGKYGQTIGKRAMAIKVLDLDETNKIGYKRAFIRESVWFFTSLAGSIYYIYFHYSTGSPHLEFTLIESFISTTTTLWFILEIVTMFFNPKRRALHDLMAKSVVIDMDVVKREERFRATESIGVAERQPN